MAAYGQEIVRNQRRQEMEQKFTRMANTLAGRNMLVPEMAENIRMRNRLVCQI